MNSRKPISREQIIHTALKLLRNRRDVQSLNLREIARALGCAHTNLYNYFSSYPQLLWEAHTACVERMSAQIDDATHTALQPECKLQAFFCAVVQVYLKNTGWFRLVWLEYLGEQRPESNTFAVTAAREKMNRAVAQIWQELSGHPAAPGKVEETVHFIHCYLVGEISNYISGRRVIEDTEAFCESVVCQAVRSTVLLLREE
ncbi:TetR/AcrR family transcriptional regulator [Faecalispora anaeroviscerum]|uniref:TetR/AcrR family transcriptional regulator n=1 Tax=Faecalispora anaeroviscerum TaxID=2991836 RepID=UPI0024B923DB|nr:TetR/AcrR family transcriptional regulator [Faecalispora anaeroviscerum]